MTKLSKNRIFVISGPAGVGKDTVLQGILKRFPDFVMVSSYTTRPKRKSNEVGNRVFISEEKFQKMINRGEFFEWQKVHSWFYGRRKVDLEKPLQEGKNVIIEVDVIGTLKFKKEKPDTVAVFIKYENQDQFKKRLRESRPEITDKEIEIRRQSMQKEMTFEKYYDYSVINPEGNQEKTIEEVVKIISNYISN